MKKNRVIIMIGAAFLLIIGAFLLFKFEKQPIEEVVEVIEEEEVKPKETVKEEVKSNLTVTSKPTDDEQAS